MMARREHEPDAHRVDAVGDLLRRSFPVHTQRRQHVGAAAPARYGAIAVLGDGNAGGGDHERGGRRDVERVAAVAARPTRIQQRRALGHDTHRPIAHCAGKAGQLLDRLAFDAERAQERADLNGACLPRHDRRHDGVGLLLGEMLALEQFAKCRDDHIYDGVITSSSVGGAASRERRPSAVTVTTFSIRTPNRSSR